MAKLDFVDCYIHFIDPFITHFRYPGVQPAASHPLLGKRIEALKGRRFVVDDFLKAIGTSNVVAAVHAEAGAVADDPAEVTGWIQQQANRSGYPQAILGLGNLEDPRIEHVLVRHLRHRNLRGIRHRSPGDFLSNPSFERGYALLEKYGLSCSLGTRSKDGMRRIRDLARRFPAIPLTLGHCGFDLAAGARHDQEFFDAWRSDLQVVAEAENISCIISGVPFFDHNWTVASLRPWVLAVIETFGTTRCMFGSHWPYDTLFSTYEKLINAYAEIIVDFSFDEQVGLFSRNGLKLYRI